VLVSNYLFQMEILKKIFRAIVLTLLILLALSGIGIVGALFTSNRERYLNKKVTIEMIDKKKNENENQVTDQIQIRD